MHSRWVLLGGGGDLSPELMRFLKMRQLSTWQIAAGGLQRKWRGIKQVCGCVFCIANDTLID